MDERAFEKKERVIDIEFTSFDGVIEYKKVYEDGTRSQPINTGEENNNPEKFRKFQIRIRVENGLAPNRTE